MNKLDSGNCHVLRAFFFLSRSPSSSSSLPFKVREEKEEKFLEQDRGE